MRYTRKIYFAAAFITAMTVLLCGCGTKDRSSQQESAPGLVVYTDAPAAKTDAAEKVTETAAVTEPETVTEYDRTNDDYFRDDDSDYVQEDTATKATKKTGKNTGKKNSGKKNSSRTTQAVTEAATEAVTWADLDDQNYVEYHFRNKKYLEQHFEKHGGEFKDDFGYADAYEYEKGASDVINNKDALHKTEAEDGDGVYYIEATNEFVILSTDGFIRTYFRPSGGIDYYNRQ